MLTHSCIPALLEIQFSQGDCSFEVVQTTSVKVVAKPHACNANGASSCKKLSKTLVFAFIYRNKQSTTEIMPVAAVSSQEDDSLHQGTDCCPPLIRLIF